ncbi:TIGR00266 family protein [Candidatus Magnetaquicoccus inordinatus]|uniref:TIGR00266 family protein n=1 Tax=Candidatus Magnetaquicoccus inordinatus TaxID=2496818 RepID=UPI00102CC455|nr:TIGR00266 family protein [Candidatus Magnetaquicoccus inordinatus]
MAQNNTPAADSPAPSRQQLQFQILGNDMQVLEILLNSGETIVAEAGAMNYMEAGITFATRLGDGSSANSSFFGDLFAAGKRLLSGESLFMTHFSNSAPHPQRVAFAAPVPGGIIAVDLQQLGGTLLCQKETFLCASYGTAIDIAFTQRLGAGFFGGEGFILQKLSGNGLAFLHACGTLIQKQLNGDLLRVDPGCLVAFTPGIDYSIERSGSLTSMLFAGEGLFLATLQGHGTVWLQSLPFARLADRILANAARLQGGGGQSRDESNLLGDLGRLIKS